MSWWNPFSWLPSDRELLNRALMPLPAVPPVQSFPVALAPPEPKPVPPPEPPDWDSDLEKHIKFSAYRGWIGVQVPSTVHGANGGIDIFKVTIPMACRLVSHLERAIAAAEMMTGEHDELLDKLLGDSEPEPEKDAACGEGGRS